MAIRSDSSIVKKIVSSLVDFLRTVEIVPGKDAEGLEVATQCLTEVFEISGQDERVPNDKLLEFFSQNLAKEASPSAPADASCSSPDLLGQFMEGLEDAGYFNDASDRASRQTQAQSTFNKTLKEFLQNGKDSSGLLCEAFKAQGNQAMSAHRYGEAVDLYTLAISICGNNAIYFANRAAAHTQQGNYNAAVSDCHKAIEIDPSYSKAYSRLGLVFYSQGQYSDSVKWFEKALELDPSNTSTSENLQSAQAKLNEAMQRDNIPMQRDNVPHEAFDPTDQPQVQATVTVRCETEIPVDNTMFETGETAQTETPSGPPFTDFVQAVMRGLASGGEAFADTVGPEFSNYVHLFGGLGQRSPGQEPEGTPDTNVQPEESRDEAVETDIPSDHIHEQPRTRVQVESSTLPGEFTNMLQAALQSAMGISQESQPSTQPQPSTQHRP